MSGEVDGQYCLLGWGGGGGGGRLRCMCDAPWSKHMTQPY